LERQDPQRRLVLRDKSKYQRARHLLQIAIRLNHLRQFSYLPQAAVLMLREAVTSPPQTPDTLIVSPLSQTHIIFEPLSLPPLLHSRASSWTIQEEVRAYRHTPAAIRSEVKPRCPHSERVRKLLARQPHRIPVLQRTRKTTRIHHKSLINFVTLRSSTANPPCHTLTSTHPFRRRRQATWTLSSAALTHS